MTKFCRQMCVCACTLPHCEFVFMDTFVSMFTQIRMYVGVYGLTCASLCASTTYGLLLQVPTVVIVISVEIGGC